MIILAVVNQKGGVGKTTTAVTLAHGLAQRDYHTLLIDLDAQGNVADCLGLETGNDLYRLLFPGMALPLAQGVTPSGRPRLDVVRSDRTTTQLKIALGAADMREYVLDDLLKDASYDVVILDCAPSMDVLHTAAMVAAHYILIPTRLDQLAVKGVRDVLTTLQGLSRISTCQLGAIIPTFYDRQTNESLLQLKHLARHFKEQVWPPIPQDVHCRESTRYGKTLWEYAPQARALLGYTHTRGQSVGGYIQMVDRVEEVLLR
ncbi:MAG: ParA family protein [Anaerolineae bacterium]|nr:ParA family protein [Anaerolineae bacterium]